MLGAGRLLFAPRCSSRGIPRRRGGLRPRSIVESADHGVKDGRHGVAQPAKWARLATLLRRRLLISGSRRRKRSNERLDDGIAGLFDSLSQATTAKRPADAGTTRVPRTMQRPSDDGRSLRTACRPLSPCAYSCSLRASWQGIHPRRKRRHRSHASSVLRKGGPDPVDCFRERPAWGAGHIRLTPYVG